MSMTGTARKLEMALCRRGENIMLEERRFFSTECNRIMTCYKVMRCEPGKKRETLLKTWSIRETTLFLADLYLHPERADADA